MSSAVSRREFLKYIAALAAVYGIEGMDLRRLERALASRSLKLPAVWISGLSCGGCTESFMSMENPDIEETLLNLIDLKYHESFTGEANLQKIAETEERLVLIVEGSVPAEESCCLVTGKEFLETLLKLSRKSEFIIALGSCASCGGIPSMGFSKTASLSSFTGRKDVINLSTCPVNPDHLAVLLAYILYYGRTPELDSYGRPVVFFSKKVHEHCERRHRYEEGRFLTDLNDPEQRDFCLYKLGCKGMHANADCSVRKWNGINSWCVSCNAGCQACSEKDFFLRMAPFFEEGKDIAAYSNFAKNSAIFAAGAATSLILKKIYSGAARRMGEKNLEKNKP